MFNPDPQRMQLLLDLRAPTYGHTWVWTWGLRIAALWGIRLVLAAFWTRRTSERSRREGGPRW